MRLRALKRGRFSPAEPAPGRGATGKGGAGNGSEQVNEDKGTHLFLYKGLVLRLDEGIRAPKAATLLLARQVRTLARGEVLDLGTGCGLLALLAARRASRVVATDVVEACVSCARRNAILNGMEMRVEVRPGDLYAPVAGETFDLILTNPPQMPVPPDRHAAGEDAAADDGGLDGWTLLDGVVREAPGHMKPGGQVVFTLFDFLGERNASRRLEGVGLSPVVVARETQPFPQLGRERIEHIRSIDVEGVLPPTGTPATYERLVIAGRKA